MNILVIGNGFDLAHGLPTRYRDFLEFVEVIRKNDEIGSGASLQNVAWGELDIKVKEIIILKNMYVNTNGEFSRQMHKCRKLADKNIWMDYFLQCGMEQKENWIDFESKISSVMQGIGCEMKMEKAGENSFVKDIPGSILSVKLLEGYDQIGQKRKEKREETHLCGNAQNGITYKELISKLEFDLDRLICALEIYLAEFERK